MLLVHSIGALLLSPLPFVLSLSPRAPSSPFRWLPSQLSPLSPRLSSASLQPLKMHSVASPFFPSPSPPLHSRVWPTNPAVAVTSPVPSHVPSVPSRPFLALCELSPQQIWLLPPPVFQQLHHFWLPSRRICCYVTQVRGLSIRIFAFKLVGCLGRANIA